RHRRSRPWRARCFTGGSGSSVSRLSCCWSSACGTGGATGQFVRGCRDCGGVGSWRGGGGGGGEGGGGGGAGGSRGGGGGGGARGTVSGPASGGRCTGLDRRGPAFCGTLSLKGRPPASHNEGWR